MVSTLGRTVAGELFTGTWLATLGCEQVQPAVAGSLVAASRDRRLLVQMTDEDAPEPSTLELHGKTVVFEGFLYDKAHLSAELGLPGDGEGADAELVVRAYERWGESSPRHLKGNFAFLIWDAPVGRLMAVHDRLGVYPLYYSRKGSNLYLSTSLEGFAAPYGPGLEVDRMVVAGLLARHHPELQETFYREVRRVPPGHMLSCRPFDALRPERYWDMPVVGAGADWVDEGELPRFGELLDQAVGRALDRGPAAIYLSGGLDSVSVAAAATQRAAARGQEPPVALSLLFPGEVSEVDTQRGVAATLGMEQSFLPFEEAVGPGGLVAAALASSAAGPSPLQNVWQPAYHSLALKGRSEGRRVVLTGGGGDEWLTVSPVIAADLIRSLDLAGLAHYVATVQRSLDLPRRALMRNVLWSNGLGKLIRAQKEQLVRSFFPAVHRARLERGLAARLARRPSWIAPEPALDRALDRRIEKRFWERALESTSPGPGGYYFSDRNNSLDHPLLAIDSEEIFEAGRKSGLMQTDIYWDADLIEFLSRVPPRLLNQGGRSKGLVRQELARRFPGLGFDRQKKLVSRDFFCSLLFSEGEAAWNSLGGAPALAQLGLVEPSKLETFVREVLRNRDERRVDDLWRVMSLESWVRPRV